MHLVLHIGGIKTGSTAVQSWLHANAESLKAAGVWYSAALGRPNNRATAVYGFGGVRDDPFWRGHGLVTPESYAAWCRRLEDDLAAELAAAERAGMRSFVVSNEHLQSTLTAPAMVARVRKLFAPHFGRCTVFCVLRPQVDLFVSRLSTAARVGYVLDASWLDPDPAHPLFDYEGLVARWAAHFEEVRCVPYRRFGGAVEWIAGCLDVPAAAPGARAENPPLDHRAIALLNLRQRHAPRAKEAPSRLLDYLDTLPVYVPLQIGEARARAFQAHFAAANARLCAARPELAAGDLEPDWSRHAGESNLGDLTGRGAVRGIAAYLVRASLERGAQRARDAARRFVGLPARPPREAGEQWDARS